MTRSTRIVVGLSSICVFGVASACNAILGNDEGVLVVTEEAGTEPTPDLPNVGDDGSDGDAGIIPTPGCPEDQRICDGICVSRSDPSFGCGSVDCAPCPTEQGAASCVDGACAIACSAGHADCNREIADGCETDLSKSDHCGACETACPATAPLCAPGPTEGTFACSTGCTAAAPTLCGTDCVDSHTSVNHCGRCNNKCATVANGAATCTNGACGFTCNADFHACPGACAANTDPAACGPTCQVCPVPANGRAACEANACTVQCNAGFADCDKNAANGCEAALTTDPAHCGTCGVSCGLGTCVNGLCVGATDAATPPRQP